MARFDIYKYASKATPLVLDVQADLLSGLNTCVVIPLVPEKQAKKEALPKLKPIIQIDGKRILVDSVVDEESITITVTDFGQTISLAGKSSTSP